MNTILIKSNLKTLKAQDPVLIECLFCHKQYTKPKNLVLAAIKHLNKKNKLNFCSKLCRDTFLGKRIYTKCIQCNKNIIKQRNAISKTKNTFCSKTCAAIYNNTHKIKGTCISKLEIFLKSKLLELYPNLEIHFNQKDTINSELDIYIPSLKLAFELNGIFHYEPIYGTEKLQQIQNNDNRKFQACLEKQIELCIIDTSSITYLKLEKTNKILNIVQNIINSRLFISKD